VGISAGILSAVGAKGVLATWVAACWPRHPAGIGAGGRAHLAKRLVTAPFARPHAGFRNGGRPLPALAQAARVTCRLAKGAATQSWSFLAKNFKGGSFCHFIGAGGLICQKFRHIGFLRWMIACTFVSFLSNLLLSVLLYQLIRLPGVLQFPAAFGSSVHSL
jgi:hypothetical protein